MPDFVEDVLSRKVKDVEEPKPRPRGTYQGHIHALPEVRTVDTKNGEAKVLDFLLKADRPGEDVSSDDLAEQPDIDTWFPFQHSYWMNEQGVWDLTQFLTKTLGIDDDGGEKSISQMLPDSVNRPVSFMLDHELYTAKDGTRKVATRIKNVAAA